MRHTPLLTHHSGHTRLLVVGSMLLHASLVAQTAGAQPLGATESTAPSPEEATESAAPEPGEAMEGAAPEPQTTTESAAPKSEEAKQGPDPEAEAPKQSAPPKPKEPEKRPDPKPEEPSEGEVPEVEEGFPLVAVGPQWGIRSPYQVVGIGAGVAVHLPHLLHVTGQFQYGMVFEEDDSGTQSSLWAEATVGYPIEWSSSATLAHADSQSRSQSGNSQTVTTTYHNEGCRSDRRGRSRGRACLPSLPRPRVAGRRR